MRPATSTSSSPSATKPQRKRTVSRILSSPRRHIATPPDTDMKKTLACLALLALAASTRSKSVDATYVATVSGIPAGTSELKMWIPLPASRGAQTISDVAIDSPYKWTRYKDHEFGNEYAFATI